MKALGEKIQLLYLIQQQFIGSDWGRFLICGRNVRKFATQEGGQLLELVVGEIFGTMIGLRGLRHDLGSLQPALQTFIISTEQFPAFAQRVSWLHMPST